MQEKTLGEILGEIYKPKYEQLFRNHPDKDEIVAKLCKGEATKEEVDRWFEEAGGYDFAKFSSPVANESRVVKFEYEGE